MNKKWTPKRILSVLLAFTMLIQLAAGISVSAEPQDGLEVNTMKVDSTINPVGIDSQTPHFSWQLQSNERGVMQTGYKIDVADSLESLKQGNYIWSKEENSDKAVDIAYDGPVLQARQRYYWQVTVNDNKGNTSVSQDPAYFEMGLLDESDWTASWIELGTPETPAPDKYTLELDFKIVNDNAGIIFAGKDTHNFLMWQINTMEYKSQGDQRTRLRPHKWVNNGVAYSDNVLIDDEIPLDKQHDWNHIKIEVDNGYVTTWVNDSQVDSRTDEHAGYGKIGFRHSKTAVNDEIAEYDNIIVYDGDGNTLFEDDFSNVLNVNFPFASITDDGTLYVQNCLDLQRDVTCAPMYRKSFDAANQVKKATVYATALGIYEIEINGQKISDDYFNPGWTNYELNQDDNNYVMYQTFDVTDLIQNGANVIGAMTGHGWYSGKLFVGGNNRYGTGSKFMCQLEIEYADNTAEKIVTDGSWIVTDKGPIISDDFQLGESYDATREIDGWSTAEYTPNMNIWNSVAVSSYAGDVIAQIGPTVKEIKEFKPLSINEIQPGVYIVDLGQNFSGIPKLSVNGPAGTVVKIRTGEMLQSDGSLYTENLRSAASTDYYVLKGDPKGEIYKPRFTFHGFRYMEITGYPGELTESDISGIALSSLQEQTGNFETSNAMVNQLQSNILWGQLGNFISVPTDCPQRDERLGYTGDGQVFIRTATMNMDVNQFFRKFMLDVTTNQREDGAIADWSPNYVTPGDSWSGSFGNSGWGDAVVVMPWTIYTAYGDTQTIYDNYDAMKKWIARYERLGGNEYIVNTSAYSDWLSSDDAKTPSDVVSTGYFAYCANLLSKMASAIGNDDDAAYYQDLFNKVRTAFCNRFVDSNGRIHGNTQTSYLVALKFDLLPTQEDRELAAKYLVEDIEARNWHLSTGFIGVAYLCPMLSEMGYSDVAYRLLLQDTFPSWLYSVKYGATTIWERWNSYRGETGEFGDVGMNSFNHYSLGSVGEWMYNYSAGIMYDEENPGYKNVIINPYLGGGLDFVNSSFESIYGTIMSNWKYTDNTTVQMQVTIPANTTAEIHVPTKDPDTVMEGGMNAKLAEGLTFKVYENGKAVFEAGSGNYTFTSAQAREYMLTISDEDELAAPSRVWINGEEIETPVIREVSAADEVILKAAPFNDIDYKFSAWSGTVESDTNEISVKIDGNVDLTISNSLVIYDNLALGKKVKVRSEVGSSAWLSAHLTDGLLHSIDTVNNGYSSSGHSTPDFGSTPEWIEIDLEEDTEFNTLRMYPRTDILTANGKTANFPKDFTIEICMDGEDNYRTIASFNDYEAPLKKPAVINFDEAVTARYVRITVTKVCEQPNGENSHYLQLAEVGIYNLEDTPEPVDKKALQEAYDQYKTTDLNKYEDGAEKTAFENALLNAKAVLENDKAEQSVIDAALKTLQDTYGALKEKEDPSADKTKLEKLIQEAEADYLPNEAKYTEETWSDLTQALQAAKNIMKNDEADQAQVDKACADLKDAIESLEYKKDITVDKSDLENAVKSAEAYKQDDYVDQGWKEFENALKNAKDIMVSETADQKKVDDALKDLNKAVEGILKKADKSKLSNAMSQASEINRSRYTASSLAVLDKAVEEARLIMDNSQLSVNDQKDVDGATDKLLAACANLMLISKAELADVIGEAEAKLKDKEDYTEDSVKDLQDALENANKVYSDKNASDEEINTVKVALQKAIKELTPVDNSTESDTGDGTDNTNSDDTDDADSDDTKGTEDTNDTDTNASGDSDSESNGTKNTGSGKGKSDGKKSPKTGDTAAIALALMGMLSTGILLTVSKKRK